MKNKIFIIQLMNGRTDEEILAERQEVVNKLEGRGYVIVNSYISDGDALVPEGTNAPVYYLGRSIKLLSEADYIYLCKDWEQGRGCRIEREVAKVYGIPEVKLS